MTDSMNTAMAEAFQEALSKLSTEELNELTKASYLEIRE